ncbi:tRNA threonylcarbamoyladenosine biosynthesis protein TsaE/hypothetical protein [Arboricoccus pini]|uniref:tRNA threonylcarbamoyladenosine biosynthesis protein TsaE n=1 Tax=Arboricoccus pini TaxID=1963835 RepID=A0A212QZQ8_9PROT|nr:tRNA (adenosine(37)-N6)-threonylcarbamoyltransferase complex ATPase subunit type 1 TsaE [Arboricoccus pini]SNB65238.1 tRNA threonylcarbamoyladenosine biosynthesis protein TsaE/hypothetical protein [Arboricoccus pini]
MQRSYDIAELSGTLGLAANLASRLRNGDVVLLEGDLGMGKSTFARALIQARAGSAIDVPSPTFTLVQPYDLGDLSILHADLYRLNDPDESRELGLEDALDRAALLVEWPERLPDLYHLDHLRVSFGGDLVNNSDRRLINVAGTPSWHARITDLAP